MAGKLSFSVAINLLTDNFKRGTNTVKNGLRSIQMQVLTFAAALGAGGLGLSNLVSRFIDVARETNRVTTALKNVSGGTAQFADNQRYLLDLAKKYGLEINALTGNFARFTASATMAGMSMADQRKIFDSVSRAITAFGLNASESDGVMLALSQMMSKGKVSSEELRLQMGEKLPIALQAMAKAAGTTVGGLDELMKKGKLMSADVLPKFAEALREMTPNVDTDNLETSINKLKNMFTGLVNSTGVQGMYKNLVDQITGLIQDASNNIKSIVSDLAAVIISVSLGRLFKWIATQLSIAQRQAMITAQRAAKEAGQTFDKAAWKAKSAAATIKTAYIRSVDAIRGAFISMLPTAIFTAISLLISKIYTAAKESKRIRSIWSNYKNELTNSSDSREANRLKELYNIATDTNRELSKRKGALSEINKQLNTNYSIDNKTLSIQGDINKKVKERIELLKAGAEVDYLTRKKLETEDKLQSLTGQRDVANQKVMSGNDSVLNAMWQGLKGLAKESLGWGSGTEFEQYSEEIYNLSKVLHDVNSRLEDATARAGNVDLTTPPPATDPDKDSKKTPLQKAEEKYAKALEELEAKREIEKLTVSEYNKALDELNKQHYIEARGTRDKDVLNSAHFKKLETAVASPKYDKTQAEFEKVQKEYNEELKKLLNQKKNGAITEEKFASELRSLTEKTILAAGAIDGIGMAGQAYIAAVQFNSAILAKGKEIKPKEYDATFDYKKDKTEILGGKLKIAEQYRDELKEAIKEGVKGLDKELNAAMTNVKTLGEALKIEEVREDIKNLERDLSEGIYSGMKDIASSSDRVVNAFSNLRDVMNDVDASGWERIMSLWNALTSVVDSLLSVANMIKTITEVTDKLSAAKQAEAAIDTATTAAKVTNAVTETTASTTALATQTAAEVAASAAMTSASTIQMAAASTAAYAGIPFAGVGLAAAQIAAMKAMIMAAAVPFATGGIVPGGSYIGDKVLARLNSGEMVLNTGQQSKLFRAIDSGRFGANQFGGPSGNVTFRIKGKDLEGVLSNNYNQKRKVR